MCFNADYFWRNLAPKWLISAWFPMIAQHALVHCNDIIMSAMASQITSVSIACSAICSGADQRKRQSSASLAFVRGIHRWPVDPPRKGPVTRKLFLFDDVIMNGKWMDLRPRSFIIWDNTSSINLDPIRWTIDMMILITMSMPWRLLYPLHNNQSFTSTTVVSTHEVPPWWRHQMETFSA